MANRSIVHVEFSAKDPAAAAKFYSDLFGWPVSEWAEVGYWMFDTEDGRGGGFNALGAQPHTDFEVKPGTVIVHVTSEDIDADLAKAESLGGKIKMPKMEIPGTGWYGVFEDPTGNLVGVYTDMPKPAEA